MTSTPPRILLVDDDQEELRLIQTLLKSGGYETVRTASSARQAFERLGLEGDAAGEETDLVLLDIMMPGIDGIEACRTIKASEFGRHLPIIMVTARENSVSLRMAFEAGATDYLVKPVFKEELLASIGTALKLKPREPSGTSSTGAPKQRAPESPEP